MRDFAIPEKWICPCRGDQICHYDLVGATDQIVQILCDAVEENNLTNMCIGSTALAYCMIEKLAWVLPPSQKYGHFRHVHANQGRLQMTNIPLHSLFSFSVLPYPALSNRPASTALSTLRLHRRRRGERGGSRRLGLDLGRPHLDLGRLGWISAAPATQQPCRLAKGRGGGAADDCRWPSPPSRQGGRASAGYQVEGGGVDLLRIRDGEDGHRGSPGQGRGTDIYVPSSSPAEALVAGGPRQGARNLTWRAPLPRRRSRDLHLPGDQSSAGGRHGGEVEGTEMKQTEVASVETTR
jgi:hypothetical protein